ncbi:MAG: XdhC family protein [Candidatus Hydrogenedentes bacterium]|nr:XdhC family protein [Candidatus Hydrogenedentota bacterium]
MRLFEQAISLIGRNQSFALAVVIRSAGSTPQKAGAKALFERDGIIHGTLGGGCLEAEARRRAMDAMDTGKPVVFDLKLDDDYGWDDGLICGGNVRVFVEPQPERHRAAIEGAGSAALAERGAFLLQIPTSEIATAHWIPESEIASYSTYPNSASLCTALKSTEPTWFEEKNEQDEVIAEVYIEPVEPSPALLIAGGGHVGQAVAKLGSWLGYRVTVIDDRAAFTEAGRYPESVHTICGDIPKEVGAFPIDNSTFIVVATRGHRHDGVVLKECIHSRAAYIGMIGSKRKALTIRKGLIEEGAAVEDDFKRVRSPIGLAIGARSVEEIAVSIMSEIIAVRRASDTAPRTMSVYAI